MPHETVVDKDGTRAFTRYFGILTPSEIFAAAEERFADTEALRKLKLIIADFSEVELISIEKASMVNFAELYLEASKRNPHVVIVGIMPADQQYGLGRMWEAYVQALPWPHRIVRSIEEAREWLRDQNIPENLII